MRERVVSSPSGPPPHGGGYDDRAIFLAPRSPKPTSWRVNGNWYRRLRAIHTWLGVFFSPLLLLFVITGWWQTFATDETKDHGPVNAFLAKLSDIHTSDFFHHNPGEPHASSHFKIYVSLMAATLILSIVLGLVIACQNPRQRLAVALALVLGIALPALILYFN